MEPERWRRLNETFDRAIDLPPTERDRLLLDTEQTDPELAAEIRRLLAVHGAEAERWDAFERGAAAALEPAANHDTPTAEGSLVLGPYRIVREIGRGGMGAVYLARRDDGAFDREVAIKLVKRGLDSDEIVRRFLAERRILAALVHPNIARLLDGGTTADGRPFFVLEYVDGRPITQHCDETHASLEERLRLFLDVCSGVELAHRNLIVHRDLKPANILVDRAGVPKLLDFGIAKLLSAADPRNDPTATALGARPMTPDYASPEQVDGRPITTAADVWGLGVLLFELLAGSSPAAATRKLAGRETRTPSRTVLALAAIAGEPGQPPSEPQRADAERLARRLRGDLDVIVGKALDIEPERRYGSARELAEDVKRHLEHRPVLARRPTWGYRLGRGIRRNKLAAAGGLAIVVLALAAIVGGVTAQRERDRAEQEAVRARAHSQFLIDVFKVSDPDQSRGREITARELLDASARQLWGATERSNPKAEPPNATFPSRPGLADDPASRADLLEAIAEVYANLGALESAELTLERTLALRRGDPTDEGEIRRAQTENLLGRVLIDASKYERADGAIRRGLTLRKRAFGSDHPAVAESLATLGELYLSRRDFARAQENLEAARAIQRRAANDPAVRQSLAQTLSQLAVLAIETERAQDAARYLDEQHRVLGDIRLGDVRAAENLALLAGLLYRQSDLVGAELRFRQSLEIRETVLEAHHPDVIQGRKNLAAMESELGRFEPAEALLRDALAVERKTLPAASPEVADTLTSLAHVVRERGDPARARRIATEAAAIYERLGAPQRAALGGALNNLALVERDLGDLAAAERLARRALALRREALGAESAAVANSLNTLGGLLHLAKRPTEAETAYRDALALRIRLLGDDHLATAASRVGLGSLLVDTGRAQRAAPLLERGLAVRKRRLPADHPTIAVAESALGACYLDLGRLREARTLLDRSAQTLAQRRGTEHPETRRALARQARLSAPSANRKPRDP